MKRPHFGGISIFCVFGRFGGPGHLCFFGDDKTGQNPQKSGLGPRRGRFSQLFRRPKSCAWWFRNRWATRIQILSRWARVMSKIPVRALAGGRAYGGVGPKRLRKKPLKFDRKSPKTKKIKLTIKMCGISSRILWQLLFFDYGPVLTHFWPFYWFWAVQPL